MWKTLEPFVNTLEKRWTNKEISDQVLAAKIALLVDRWVIYKGQVNEDTRHWLWAIANC